MYETFFALKCKPFALLPNPEFLYLSRSHKKTLTYLDYAIRERVGFTVMTGEIGSGKTTLLRNIFNNHQQNIVLSRIFNTRVNADQLLVMINEDFGLTGEKKDKPTLLRELNDFLIQQYSLGNNSILIVDEAQNLTPDVLEELRMLSNLETDSVKLLHIILAGQPELRQTLALPELLQLRQRISCFSHIAPLDRDEIEPYILHRLEKAGNRQAALFTPQALALIWQCSRGIPRLINTICDFLLLLAFADGVRTMTPELVQAVIDDLDFENCYWEGPSSVVAAQEAPACHKPSQSHTGGESGNLLTAILNRFTNFGKRDPRSKPAARSPREKKGGWFGFLFRTA